jgi:hypothetical protein
MGQIVAVESPRGWTSDHSSPRAEPDGDVCWPCKKMRFQAHSEGFLHSGERLMVEEGHRYIPTPRGSPYVEADQRQSGVKLKGFTWPSPPQQPRCPFRVRPVALWLSHWPLRGHLLATCRPWREPMSARANELVGGWLVSMRWARAFTPATCAASSSRTDMSVR